jgi:hypothetical protein
MRLSVLEVCALARQVLAKFDGAFLFDGVGGADGGADSIEVLVTVERPRRPQFALRVQRTDRDGFIDGLERQLSDLLARRVH